MTRGNQREKAREKNLKNQPKAKNTESASTLKKRQEDDAQKMRDKNAAAIAKKEAEAQGLGGGGKG